MSYKINNLNFEEKIFAQAVGLLGAIDEAGRGPLAGPVVAACLPLAVGFKIPASLEEVRDSKCLSPKKRQYLSEKILENFPDIGIGICDRSTIDRINILQASFLAMKKAIGGLKTKPDYLIVDGAMTIPNTTYRQQAVIKGDRLVFSIAAASIIAKVTRDRMMVTYHEQYPQYGFDRHMGYGTGEHLKMLTRHGPCPIHRYSFQPVKKLLARNKLA